MSDTCTVTEARWQDPQDRDALAMVRRAVFIEEQAVPEALEWDGLDEAAFHLLARTEDGTPLGTVRLLADGHIGRMAVLKPHRGRKIGSALLQSALAEARRRGLKAVYLDAQVHALPFYIRFGFVAEGPEFLDAGIVHRRMRRPLDEPSGENG